VRLLKDSKTAEKVSTQAAIYFSAVLEYITAEVLDATIELMKIKKNSKLIRPYDIISGISSDHELTELFKECEIESFDPLLRAPRVYVIGRTVDENFYKGRKAE
jgi:hypothetical protein